MRDFLALGNKDILDSLLSICCVNGTFRIRLLASLTVIHILPTRWRGILVDRAE